MPTGRKKIKMLLLIWSGKFVSLRNVEFGCVQRTGLGEGGEIEFRPTGTAAD